MMNLFKIAILRLTLKNSNEYNFNFDQIILRWYLIPNAVEKFYSAHHG